MAAKVHPDGSLDDVQLIGRSAEQETGTEPPKQGSVISQATTASVTAKVQQQFWFLGGKCLDEACDTLWPKDAKHVEYLRKAVRVVVCLGIVIAGICLVVLLAFHRSKSDIVEVDEGIDLSFELDKCQLVFRMHPPLEHQSDDRRVPGDATFFVYHYVVLAWHDVSDYSLTWEAETPEVNSTLRSFRLINTGDMESCTVFVEMNFGAQMGNIEVKCLDECVVVMATEDVEAFMAEDRFAAVHMKNLIMDAGSVTQTSTVRLSGVEFESMNITLGKGEVYLEDISIQLKSYVSIADGSFYGQLRQDLRVSWNSSSSYYCLAAPVTPTPMLHGDCNDTDLLNVTNSSGQCGGYVHLCENETTCFAGMTKEDFLEAWTEGESVGEILVAEASDDEYLARLSRLSTTTNITQKLEIVSDKDADKFVQRVEARAELDEQLTLRKRLKDRPQLYVEIPRGGFYVTRIPFGAVPYLEPHRGAGLVNRSITLSAESEMALGEAKAVLENTATSGRAFVLRGPANARLARPGISFLFSLLPSAAYASLKPWWLAWIAPLLLNTQQIETINVEFLIGPCPYHSVIDVNSLSHIGNLLQGLGAADPANKVFYILNAERLPGDRALEFAPVHGHKFGEMWPMITFHENAWLLNQTEFDSSVNMNLSENISLMVAMSFSIAIGVILGTIVVYTFWNMISIIVQTSFSSSSHINHYSKMSSDGFDSKAGPSSKYSFDNSNDRDDYSDGTDSELIDDVNRTQSFIRGFGFGGGPIDQQVQQPDAKQNPQAATPSPPGEQGFDALRGFEAILLGKVRMITIYELPPLFGIIDHLFIMAYKRNANSLTNFLTIGDENNRFRKPNNSQPFWPGISITEFKDIYSKYCFLTGMMECNLSRSAKSASILASQGFKLLQLPAEEQKDSFIRIRFKTQRELEWELTRGRPRQQPGENSLDFFLRASCKRTKFDTDYIDVDYFKSQYTLFCEQYRIQEPVTVSKALMQHRKGISSSKLPDFRIVPLHDADSGNTSWKLDMVFGRTHIERMCNITSGVDTDIVLKSWKWVLIDVGLAFSHMLVIVALSTPLNFYMLFLADYYYPFSTADFKFAWKWSDMPNRPAKILHIPDAFPFWFYFLTIPGIVLGAVQYVELMLYYWEQPLPFDSLRYFAQMRKASKDLTWKNTFNLFSGKCWSLWQFLYVFKFIRFCLHCYQWFMLILILYVTAVFGTIMAVWCLLAALINPEAFLAYSTGLATLIAFVSGKYAVLQKLYHKSLDEILEQLQKMIQEKVNFAIQKMVEVSVAFVEDAGGKAVDAVGDVIGGVAGEAVQEQFEQHVMTLAGSALGRNIASAGFDINLVVRLASGDMTALEAFAEESGVPGEIIDIMVGLAHSDKDKVVNSIGAILRKYQNVSPIAPELAIALAELALTPTRPKAEKVSKALFRYGLPMMLKLWARDFGGFIPQPVSEAQAKFDEFMSTVKEFQKDHPELHLDEIAMAMQNVDDGERDAPDERDAILRKAVAFTTNPEAAGALLSQAQNLASDPELRKLAHDQFQKLASPENVQIIGQAVGDKLGVTPRTRDMAIMLLLDVLPPFMKGLVSLVKREYHEFVKSLVYVHSSLCGQKPFLVARFGASTFQNFERIRPILHMLDILMRTGSVQDSIFAILEDEHVLGLAPEIVDFTKFMLWLRPPNVRQDILRAAKNPMQIKFLCSWSDRKRAVHFALNFFGLNTDFEILVEVLIALALEDIRALTHNNVGPQMARAAMILIQKSGLQLFKGAIAQEMLAELFNIAFTLVVGLQAGTTGGLFATLQDRTGIDRQRMMEVVDLFLHRTVPNSPAPKGMHKWRLVQAAANFVPLEIDEAVGLAHLCFGHTESTETSVFIREMLRRQGINPFGLDRFVKNLLAIQFRTNDEAVMTALQELQVRHRFTSIIGLHQAPPRYFSEDMLLSVGICNREVLRARHAVPFTFEENPAAWREWIAKASLSIQGKPIGDWQHIDIENVKRHVGLEGEARVAVTKTNEPIAEEPLRPGIPVKRSLHRELSVTMDGSPLALNLGSVASSQSASTAGMRSTGTDSTDEMHRAPSMARELSDEPGTVLKASNSGTSVRQPRQELHKRDSELHALKGVRGAEARQAARREAAKQRREQVQEIETLRKETQSRRDLPSSLQDARCTPSGRMDHRAAAYSVDGIDEKDRFQVLQLNWLSTQMTPDLVRFIVTYYNKQLHYHKQNHTLSTSSSVIQIASEPMLAHTTLMVEQMHKQAASMAPSKLGGPAVAAQADIDFQRNLAQRKLLNVQDTSTGIVEQLDMPTQDQIDVILRILDLKRVVGRITPLSSGKGKRAIVVQNIAEMLGVDTSRLSIFFDLMSPERTKDARRAIEAVGKAFLPDHETKAISDVAYTIKRSLSVFDALRTKLWDVAHRFHLPRFLASATLLPNISYPPHIREIGSIAHFFLTPVLLDAEVSSRAQLVLYNLMGLAAGSPPNSNLLAEVIGVTRSRDTFAVTLVRFFMRKNMTDKLQLIPDVLRTLLDNFASPRLADIFNEIFPFMLFFCGFPFAELPHNLDPRKPTKGNVFSIIQERTGISKLVLQGIDLSQWSISPFSHSDENSFDCNSVLGLLLPMFQSARVSFSMHSSIPNDGIVKAIVSLAHCRTENLEFLAEALRLDTFLVQLLVQLVDLSRNTHDPARITQVMQTIKMSAGITRQLNMLGINPEKFLGLLELSFPDMEDIAALPGLLDKLGLARLGVDRSVVEFLYATVNCGLLHLRHVFDPAKHQRATTQLCNSMEAILENLGFRHQLVPVTAIRLFQGDFLIFDREEPMMKVLLPSKLDRELAVGVTGLLSFSPPSFEYNPAVASGVAEVVLHSGEGSAYVNTETQLPPNADFRFWIFDADGKRLFHEEFEIRWTRAEENWRNAFAVTIKRPVGAPIPAAAEELHLWWRAFPAVEGSHSHDDFRQERRHIAKGGVKALERICGQRRIHWGGVAAVWWYKLDVHPLFILLAEGEVSAIRLASDLLGVPDVVLAFLLSHVLMAPSELLRPLLLSDLCAENLIRRLIYECMEGVDEGDRTMDEEFMRLEKETHDEKSVFETASKDHLPKAAGMGYAPEKRKADNHSNLVGPGIFDKTLDRFNLGNLFNRSPSKDTVDSNLSRATALISEIGYSSSPKKNQGGKDDDDESSDDDDQEDDADLYDDDAYDDDDEEVLDDAFDDEILDMEQEPTTSYKVMALTDPNRFVSWTKTANLDDFPDELGALLNPELLDKEDAPESLHMQRLLSGTATESMEDSKVDRNSIYENIAVNCLKELEKQSKSDSWDELHVLDKWLHRWKRVPNNFHFLLSLLLVHLHAILDSADNSVSTMVTEAPTVSLMIGLSKIIQARKTAASLLQQKGKLIKSYQLQTFLMPAAWGFEMHIRRGIEKRRKGFMQDIRHLVRHSPMDDDDQLNFKWAKGGIWNFNVPVPLYKRFAGLDLQPVSSEHWMWEDWGWPCDHLAKMCCRVVQVARLALGVAEPLSCWHPQDDAYRLHLAMKDASGKHHYHENSALQHELSRRGWGMYKKQPTLDESLVSSQDLSKRAHGRKMLNLSERELRDDLLSTTALTVLWSFVAGAANPDLEAYSWKKVRFENELLARYASIHAAVACLIATDFGSQKKRPELLQCTGQAFGVILQPDLRLGARRIGIWAQTICAEIGLEYQTLEALVQVAHGFVQNEKGRLIAPVAMEALAARLRMPKNSVPILQSICTKGWDLRSSKVLAERLGHASEVVHALISASMGEVMGWIELHKCLFRRSKNPTVILSDQVQQAEDDRTDWEQRMLDACCEFGKLPRKQRGGTTKTQMQWLSDLLDTILPILTTCVYDRGYPRRSVSSPTEVWAAWRSGNEHSKESNCLVAQTSNKLSLLGGGVLIGEVMKTTLAGAGHVFVSYENAGNQVASHVGQAVDQVGQAGENALNAVGDAVGQVGQTRITGTNAVMHPFKNPTKSGLISGGEVTKEELLMKVMIGFILHILSGQNSAAGQLLAGTPELWQAAGLSEEQATYLRDFSYLINHSGQINAKDITQDIVENLARPLSRFVRQVKGETPRPAFNPEGFEPIDWFCACCRIWNNKANTHCEKCQALRPTDQRDTLQIRMVGLLQCLFGMVTHDHKKVLKSIRKVMVDSVVMLLARHSDVILEQSMKMGRKGTMKLKNMAIGKVKPEIVNLMVQHSSMRALIMVQSLTAFIRLREDRSMSVKNVVNQVFSLKSMAKSLHKTYASGFSKTIRNLYRKATNLQILTETKLDRVKFRELVTDDEILLVMKHLSIPVSSVEEILDMFDHGDGTFNVPEFLDGLANLRKRVARGKSQGLFVEGTQLRADQVNSMQGRLVGEGRAPHPLFDSGPPRPPKEERTPHPLKKERTPHVLAVGDQVVAKRPEFRGSDDNPWFAAIVTSIDEDNKQCSVLFHEGGETKDGLQLDEVYYAPGRDGTWGTGDLRGNSLLPDGALPVTLRPDSPADSAKAVEEQASGLSLLERGQSMLDKQVAGLKSKFTEEITSLTQENTPSVEEVVRAPSGDAPSISEVELQGVTAPAMASGLPPPPPHSPPRAPPVVQKAWGPANLATGNPALSAARPPVLMSKNKKEQQAFNAMMHLFIGMACSDYGGFPGSKVREILEFIGELEHSFLPILAGAATGRWEQVLSQLKDLTFTLCEKVDPDLADEIQFVIDLITLIGVDKELVRTLIPVEGDGISGGKFLEVFTRRLTRFACEKLGAVEQQLELTEIVDQLVRLLIVLCVEATPAEIMARLSALINPLEKFLLSLLGDDKKLVEAARTLVHCVYEIAREAPGLKASEYVDLFRPADDGSEAKAIIILKALKDLLLPFMPEELHQPLLDVLRILAELSQLSADPTPLSFAARTPIIIEKLAVVLCVPKHNVSGIIALANGDWAGAADLCRPFCNIDPEVFAQMSQILPIVRKTIVAAKDAYTSSEEMAELTESNSHIATRVRQIAAEALRNNGSKQDLFELVDIDRNGTITIEEFELLMKRLGFDLNHHRLLEILSACKKTTGDSTKGIEESLQDGLTLEEFETALTYLQKKVAFTSMEELLVSWPRLLTYLIIFTLILVLTMAFIFLGVQAFVTGGVFSAIINSGMTLAAGLSLSTFKAGQGERNARDPTGFKNQLEEVTLTVFGQH